MRKFSLMLFLLLAVCGSAAFAPAQASILIKVDKSTQRMTVSVDGEQRWVWPVSTGRSGHETPSGRFTAFRLEEDHYSKEWDEAPMPYSIFFTAAGHAIHGSYETKRLGQRASHGCVRLSPSNAAKLFALVQQHGVTNAKVVVTGGSDAPLVAKRRTKPAVEQARAPATPGAPGSSAEQAYGYTPTAPLSGGPVPVEPVPPQPYAHPYPHTVEQN